MQCERSPRSRADWSVQALSETDPFVMMTKAVVDVVDRAGWSVLYPGVPFPCEDEAVVIKQTPFWLYEERSKVDHGVWIKHVKKLCAALQAEAKVLEDCRGPRVCHLYAVREDRWTVRTRDHQCLDVPSVALVLKHYVGRDLFA
jgi:hypothetical protein